MTLLDRRWTFHIIDESVEPRKIQFDRTFYKSIGFSLIHLQWLARLHNYFFLLQELSCLDAPKMEFRISCNGKDYNVFPFLDVWNDAKTMIARVDTYDLKGFVMHGLVFDGPTGENAWYQTESMITINPFNDAMDQTTKCQKPQKKKIQKELSCYRARSFYAIANPRRVFFLHGMTRRGRLAEVRVKMIDARVSHSPAKLELSSVVRCEEGRRHSSLFLDILFPNPVRGNLWPCTKELPMLLLCLFVF